MLVIDDNKLKLAKMQETLLARTINDRKANIEQYKKIVIEIDSYAFSNLLEELNHLEEHKGTLEDELQFLEEIKDTYQQLLELQLGFKKVYKLYQSDLLELSDLSQLNITYIDNRISTINGYLINLKNIDINKNKLQELNDRLIEEEKSREFLSKRLLEMESSLRDNFINAEGRIIKEGKLQYTSTISEYNDIDIDLKRMLETSDVLEAMLSSTNNERVEVEEKLRTAEICYNSIPNAESKQILDEINKEYLKIKYKLTMLKIIKLISLNYDDYDKFKEKREQLLDLIKYRLTCINKLGIHLSIDPFSRIKVSDQLEMLANLPDNYKQINRIKKEIALLSERVEEMLSQNNKYMIELNDTAYLSYNKDIKQESPIIEDISVVWDEDDYFTKAVAILDNQVIDIRQLPTDLNMGIVSQKTNSVIKRVNEMLTYITPVEDKKTENTEPLLVIVPAEDTKKEITSETKQSDLFKEETAAFEEEELEEIDSEVFEEKELPIIDKPKLETQTELVSSLEPQPEPEIEMVPEIAPKTSSIFETVVPFVEPPLFSERSDNSLSIETTSLYSHPINFDETLEPVLPKVETPSKDDSLQLKDEEPQEEKVKVQDYVEKAKQVTPTNEELSDNNDEMEQLPDAFWVTQEDDNLDQDAEVVPSFDEQIDILLGSEKDTKTRKLVA